MALAAWNDLSENDVVDYLNWDFGEAGLGGQYLDPLNGPLPHPSINTPATCDPIGTGQACEYNWGIALRQAVRFPNPQVSLEDAMLMVSAFHGSGNWVISGATTDFADDFDLEMQSYLTASEYTKWAGLASDWEIRPVTRWILDDSSGLAVGGPACGGLRPRTSFEQRRRGQRRSRYGWSGRG